MIGIFKNRFIKYPVLLTGFLFLLFFLISSPVLTFGQTINSDADTIKKKKHSPKLAMLMSTALPGLGQAYNKKYWKIPVVYAGLGALGYLSYRNGNYYNTFKRTYADLLATGNTDTTAYLYGVEFNLYGLESAKNYYRRYRDMYTIFTVGFYLLNIIDANVDAHLYDFDISDDLSLKISPSAEQLPMAGPIPGIRFRLTF